MKNFKKILSSQQGISLIEITVAAAISVIISMAVVKTNQTGQKGMTKLTTDMDLKMWQQQRLMQTLGEPGACANTFPAHSISSSASVPAIRDTQNNIVYSAGDDIEGGAWTINSMSIDAVPAADITPTVNKYTTNLRLVMQRKNKESFGGSTKSIIVPIVMVRASDPSTQLVSCSAGSVGADGLWNQELTSGGYIHSASSNVIIGSNGSTPIAPFQIDINSGSEWPGTGSGVYPAMKVSRDSDAIVFGSSNQAALYQSGNCLVMGNGMTGDISSKIESCEGGVLIGSQSSSVSGLNSIVLGGSAAQSTGTLSVASGEKARAMGANSFSQGEHTTVTGRNSATFGYGGLVSGANSFGAGYNAHAYGLSSISLGNSSLARGDNSIAIGNGSVADGLYAVAIGRYSRSTYPESMVLSGSGTQTYSTNASQFTAKFNNGFKFIASNASYPSGSSATDANTEDSGVFIDPNGNMGIGSDLSQSPTSSFTEDRTPKLFVNGDVEVFGDLYVNGNKVGAELTWTNIASVNSYHICSGCRVTRDSTSRVQLNGLLIASAIPPVCYSETSNILVLPVGKRPDRTLRFLVPHGATGTKILLIYSNGNVRMQGGNCNSANSIPLDGISFYGTI
jgi:hypothetical protein